MNKVEKITKGVYIICFSTIHIKHGYVASGEVSVTAISKLKQTTKMNKETKTPLDPAKVVFLSETFCRVACENLLYDNPPHETSRLDCVQANRPLPCDLCSSRYHILEPEFSPSADQTTLPPFILPESTTKQRKPRKKADELKETELEETKVAFVAYEEQLYAKERLVAPHRYCPRALYFSDTLRDTLAVQLLKIKSQAMLNVILASNEWPFIESQGSNLFDLISSLQTGIISRRQTTKSKRSTKKTREVSLESSDSDTDEHIHSTLPSKRTPLIPAENQPRAKRQPRQPQQSLAEAESY